MCRRILIQWQCYHCECNVGNAFNSMNDSCAPVKDAGLQFGECRDGIKVELQKHRKDWVVCGKCDAEGREQAPLYKEEDGYRSHNWTVSSGSTSFAPRFKKAERE